MATQIHSINNPPPETAVLCAFKPGDVVRHPTFGQGKFVQVFQDDLDFGEVLFETGTIAVYLPQLTAATTPEMGAYGDPYPKFPAELKALDRWCVYKLVWSEEKQKNDKIPYCARTDKPGNPITANRCDYATAVAAFADKSRGYDGLGYGFDYADGYTGRDYDHCVVDGKINPVVQEIVDAHPTYTEFSPSGNGIHVFSKGWQVQVVNNVQGHKVGLAEIYSGLHYFTVTGQQVPGTPSTVNVCDLSDSYDRIMAGEFKPAKPLGDKTETGQSSASAQEHAQELEHEPVQIETEGTCTSVTTKLALLMNGNIVGTKPFVVADDSGHSLEYDSPSEADQALCNVLAIEGYDADKIDDEFRKSALYRDKWDRKDYRDRTIKHALQHKHKETNEAPIPVLYASKDKTGTDTVVEPPDENSEAAIPAFDKSVVNGIYAKFVELVTQGTTLAPQFAYQIAKTIVGLRMAGKVKFENLDVEPRYYTALIGETGSGKGEAWRRTFQILQPEGAQITCKIKIIASADSGAGIKDVFLEVPEDWPVLCYVDEITSLGNKARDTRNPGILDTMIELADSTFISRVLAKRGGGSKTKHDARFAMVMCGQDGPTYTGALAGRTRLGLYDRLTPEYSVPQETGELPAVDNVAAIQLLAELDSLDYQIVMNMSPDAKAHLEAYWKAQPAEVRKKARWKKNLALDAFMSAFGRGVKTVEVDDVGIAIKIFTRQLVIRRVCFSTEVPDRIGYYLGLIKRITERMRARLAAGIPQERVAKSRRDYEKETHAHRNNEEHIFARAWDTHCHVHLDAVKIKQTNGRDYIKYLPKPEDE